MTLIAICDKTDLNNYCIAINVCIFQDDCIQIIMWKMFDYKVWKPKNKDQA